MNVVLVHPVHGAKVAICDAEIVADEKVGWTRYTPPTPTTVSSEPDDAPEADKPKRRNARKPIEQPNEVPDFLNPASDESEGT